MANIKINDLAASEIEFVELSDLELDGIVGGGWFKKAFGFSSRKFITRVAQVFGILAKVI
ncbi:hypothetical protein QHH11_04975 [Aphanizomenon sp. PH219]|nr:hypothetical protein [Aphanizomenon sp. 202]MDK2458494.1 hypothetical protein [Aphanizomenon sp. PH219]